MVVVDEELKGGLSSSKRRHIRRSSFVETYSITVDLMDNRMIKR